MELNTWTTVLIAIAPAISAIITILAGLLKISNIIKKLNRNHNEQEKKANAKLIKNCDDIAKINARLTSIEKYLLEEKENRK